MNFWLQEIVLLTNKWQSERTEVKDLKDDTDKQRGLTLFCKKHLEARTIEWFNTIIIFHNFLTSDIFY
jgi:hypothetical protein